MAYSHRSLQFRADAAATPCMVFTRSATLPMKHSGQAGSIILGKDYYSIAELFLSFNIHHQLLNR